MNSPTALIAEDEPLLAQALQAALAQAWPALQVLATVGDGHSAVAQALRLQPDVLFFDIRMPGLDGLEAAAALADAWTAAKPFPILVFVTAYDQYAVQAFEVQAMDYLLKPVQPDRLQKTVAKLQSTLAARTQNTALVEGGFESTLSQLRHLLGASAATPTTTPKPTLATPLQFIQASLGQQIHMVPLAEVVYFEAADKYVRVLTAQHEYTVRTPLKELLPQLADGEFWQIHRGTVVRAACIARVWRDEAGKQFLALREREEKLAVSRLYAHLFKAM